MRALVAWRMLVHEKGRSVLAVGGILVAVLLMFVQLGLYMSVPKGSLLFFNAMRYDVMLTSSSYFFQLQPSSFPRRRLYQAMSLPEVTHVNGIYHGSGRGLNAEGGAALDVFVIGFNLDDSAFDLPDLERQLPLLRQADTILMDTSSRPEIGSLDIGRRIEIENRSVTIGGSYNLGRGFLGFVIAVTSDLNFLRIFPNQGGLGNISFGLLTLKSDADPNDVAARLRELLPDDVRVFTRAELADFEVEHWVTNTSTGLIFGIGVVVAVIVGSVILYQTLATQITRQLPQYATLKAIGYTDRELFGIVVMLAVLLSTAGFLPSALLASAIYWIVHALTQLPIEMTVARLGGVLVTSWCMAIFSGLLALRLLRRADPAELL